MKKLVISLLQQKAKRVIELKKPTVVAVTGSYGKTATKNAIARALSPYKDIRATEGNFNNEIGLPLAILGEESPERSPFGWLALLLRRPQSFTCPPILVLEYGADHPGDIRALCQIAQPHIAVVTGVSTVHAEFYSDIDALAREKASLIECLADGGFAILNADDDRVREMASTSPAHELYGVSTGDLTAHDIRIIPREDDSFEPGEIMAHTSAVVMDNGAVIGQLDLKNALGYAPVMSALAAIAVAKRFNIEPMQAIKALNQSFTPMQGRLNPIAGNKGSLIIDDSYNAAPSAVLNGLQTLKIFQPHGAEDRRIAVLGSLAELGKYAEDEHRKVGFAVAEVADLFIAVGEGMRMAVEAAKEAGMDEKAINWFGTSKEAGRYLDRLVQSGDIIYVKGSQSSRMEYVVKDVMAEPLRAKELLVRQGEKWLAE